MKYQNTQFHNECQMVAVVNALHYWGMPSLKPGSKAYRFWAWILGGKTDIGCNPNLVSVFAKRAGLRVVQRRGIKRKWVKHNLPVAGLKGSTNPNFLRDRLST